MSSSNRAQVNFEMAHKETILKIFHLALVKKISESQLIKTWLVATSIITCKRSRESKLGKTSNKECLDLLTNYRSLFVFCFK